MIYCQGMQSVWLSRVCLINDVICGCWFLNIFSPWSAMGWVCWTVSCYRGYCCFFLSFLELLLCYYCCFSSGAQVFRSVISSLWISPFSIRKCPSIAQFMLSFWILSYQTLRVWLLLPFVYVYLIYLWMNILLFSTLLSNLIFCVC